MKLLPCLAGLALGSNVLDLGASNFQEAIDANDNLLVEFYAPWCGHCKKLAPEWEKAADRLADEDPPIKIAKVDCPANSDLCQKYGVSGYPTIKMFKGGEEAGKYEQARSSDAIVAYMRKQAGPASVEVATQEKWDKVKNNKEALVIGYFSDYTSGNGNVFMKLADNLRDDYRFANIANPEILAASGLEGKVVLQRPRAMKNKFEESDIEYPGDKWTVGLLKNWVRENASGACPVISTESMSSLKRPALIAFYNVDYDLDPKGTQYWRNRVMKVGLDYDGKVNLAVGNNKQFAGLLNGELGGDKSATSGKPMVVVLDENDKKYIMEEEFNSDMVSLRAFIDSYLAGNVEPFVKSEAVPENQGANVKVVGKNFDDVVMNSDADVFLKMYAPWCGHCKSMAPAWEEFAESLKDDDSVIVGEFDATSNDVGHPAYSVSGYPTIFWIKNGDKKNPQKYQGGRTVDDFKKWVADNRSKAKDEL